MSNGEAFHQDLEERLRKIGPDDTKRKLALVGLLNQYLRPGKKVVLVGGSLVQFYSAGGYRSFDIDLVAEDRPALAALLKAAGFVEDVRGFESPEFDLVIDISTKPLRSTDQVTELRMGDLQIPVVTIEDAIVDRLAGAKHWRSAPDWEQALQMYAANRPRVRHAVLAERAKKNDVHDYLERLEKEVSEALPDRR